MRKLIPIILISLLHLYANGQNYQCLQADSLRYYINSYGYLRAIHLDSVRTIGTDTVYYPFHTTRGPYLSGQILDTTAGSWVGKKVAERQDGTFLFDNWWQDTVVIRSQAGTGDSWIFYDDSSTHYYRAEVTAVDTMTVLSALDSVKHILITAYDGPTPDPSDSLNNFEIILSKEHGFVQVFDLYMFPYHPHDTVYVTGRDYYLDRSILTIGLWPPTVQQTGPLGSFNCIFKLIPFKVPSDSEMYDWNPGDEIQYDYEYGFQNLFAPLNPQPLVTYYYSISQKYFTNGSPNLIYTGWTAAVDTVFDGDFFGTPGVVIPQAAIPECRADYLYYYYPRDTSNCIEENRYIAIYDNADVSVNTFEPQLWYYIYKQGIGLTDWDMYSFGDGSGWGNHMRYYKKNGDSCGHLLYPDTSQHVIVATTTTQENTLKIYPNPTDKTLHIQLSKSTSGIVYTTLYNIMGQAVYSSKSSDNQYSINTKDIPAGIYSLQIRSNNATVINRKIIIEH